MESIISKKVFHQVSVLNDGHTYAKIVETIIFGLKWGM